VGIQGFYAAKEGLFSLSAPVDINRVDFRFCQLYTGLWCVNTGLLCGNAGLFCGNTGLFCGTTGLICGNTRLFCGNTGLI